MANADSTATLQRADHQASKLDAFDAAAHVAASYRRQVPPASKPARTVLERFSAGAPRGVWPAESFAAERRREGIPARVVMDLDSDSFLVIVEVAS